MKNRSFGVIILLSVGVLALTWCNNKNNTGDKDSDKANLAAVYCEEQWGKHEVITVEDMTYWECTLPDWTVCEEWSYYGGRCPGNFDIEHGASEIYSQNDIDLAANSIVNAFYEWNIPARMKKVTYLGDEIITEELTYLKELAPEFEDYAVFSSDFYTLNSDTAMSGDFEPNTNIEGWIRYLGRDRNGEWNVLDNKAS